MAQLSNLATKHQTFAYFFYTTVIKNIRKFSMLGNLRIH